MTAEMVAEAALTLADTLVFVRTGEHLGDLQRAILLQVWQGQKYLEISESYGYTEGHIKDVASQLWKLLSKALGEKITKRNCRAGLERHLQASLVSQVSGDAQVDIVNALPTWIEPKNSNFIGRTGAIAHLDNLINQGARVIVIQGEGGLGKTTLAQQYLQPQKFELVLELLMAKETQNIAPAERVVEEWLKQDLQQEPGLEFGVTLGRLKRQLETRRIGIFIDNLEPALDQQGRLIELHRSYVELFRVLADPKVQSVTLITSRDRLCEAGLDVEHYRLAGLDQQAWQQFFSKHQVSIEPSTLREMHRAYAGNAKAMGILCGAIQEDFDGDMADYWQENYGDPLSTTDLKNLVVSQINRLQSLDPEAYRLFCRLGCYRYQDVPAIPTQGLLSLLWDVPVSQHRQIISSLRNRSLVEYHKGEYWLHPMIRTEAIARIRASGEWETVNHKAAEFWTKNVDTIDTIRDALQALEAYYHFIEIQDFELAGKVILKTRHNHWQQFLPLGSSLYRLGLLQPLLAAISQVISNVKSDHNLSELYNILGDLYWITGQIHKAIKCQEKTIAITTDCLKSLVPSKANKPTVYYLRMLEVDSLLSMGLYKIDLWEIEAAALYFRQVIDFAENTDHGRWAEKASVCLALVNSYLSLRTESYSLANIVYHSLLNEQLFEHTGRFAYFIQILGQTYVNLGDFEKANEMCQRALSFAEESHYTQVKAKTLNGLAEMHRQQEAFELALTSHSEAIDLLDKIGAKCDLAEAYFQLGLTYQKMEKFDQSKLNFNQAIQLFTEMAAPKQVEKVLKTSKKASQRSDNN
jgi:tetratricopeptide (TPR) repeat protein